MTLKDKPVVKFKQKVYEQYLQIVNEKINILQKMLQDLIESTRNETKSSAGDKYETGRAILQIEQDNVRKQLKEALHQKAAFEKIDPSLNTLQIAKGSLVKTDKGYFYVSIALGKISIEATTVIALSPQSPLGSQLIGLKRNDTVNMNGMKYTIESIE